MSRPSRFRLASQEERTYSGRPFTPRAVGSLPRTIPNFVATTTTSRAAAPQGAADELLVRVRAVDVGGVEHRDAEVERPVDRGDRLRLVAGAVEVGHAHAAEADRPDLEALGAEPARLHGVLRVGAGSRLPICVNRPRFAEFREQEA